MNPTSERFPILVIDTGVVGAFEGSSIRIVPPEHVPEPYRGLLVHHHHMTVTVESHYGESVDVRVLASRRHEESYHREILLELQTSRTVVQYGIVRIDLAVCSAPVRDDILEEKTPLGRILIEHNVLRRIEPMALLEIDPGPKLVEWFGLPAPRATYGRMGVIFCDDRPAIAVLEILAPV